MNTQTTSRRTRSKRTSVIALGLVAILAGVAVAYFLTSQKFAGNRAVGGQLTVETTLPLDFTSEYLYPTSPAPTVAFPDNITNTIDPPPAHEFAALDQDFGIDNNNTVKVRYFLWATCEECIENPGDTPEQAAARADKRDQFNNLWIEITPIGGSSGAETKKVRLADLNPNNRYNLGDINAETPADYNMKLWLQNDPTRAQPQNVESIWEFIIDARTPVS